MKTMPLRHIHRLSRLNYGIATFLTVLSAWPVFAETPGTAGGPRPVPPIMQELDRLTEPERGPGAGAPEASEESSRHFEARKRERLMQALHLDEATQSRLSQRLEQLDQKGEDLRRQRKAAFESLREQAQSLRKEMRRGPRNGGGRGPSEQPPSETVPSDTGALRQALERVYAVEDAMTGLRRERMQVGRDLLTPEQQVRLLLFNMKFQKEMRERLQQEQGAPEGGRSGQKR